MRTAFGWHCGYVNIRSLNREDSLLYFPPEAFGPFRVLHQIGAGALGPVFRAYEPGGDRLVAVKVFRVDLTPEQTALLARELEQLAARDLQHRVIAAPVAAGVEAGAAFLAQEYAVGDSLDVHCREQGVLPLREAVRLVTLLADGIDAAADQGVVHHALHPRDIIVSGDAARITGFGVATALSAAGVRVPNRPPYADPDAPSDVFSLASITFEAITGRRFSATNLEGLEHERLGRLRDAFASVLLASPASRPSRARDFASLLVDAAPAEALDPPPRAVAASAPPETESVPPEPEIALPEPGARDVIDLPLESPLEPLTLEPAEVAPVMEIDEPVMENDDPAIEVEETGRREWLPIILLIGVLAAALVLGYGAWRSQRGAPSSGSQAPATSASVSETTVDVPPARSTQPEAPPAAQTPAPSRQAMPAPSPSRPAAGVATKTSARGVLLIRSTPPNIDVAVNGQPRGKTPTTLRDLPLGSYTIRVARDGYAPEERSVQLTARRSMAAVSFLLRPAPARAAPVAPAAPADKPVAAGNGSINVQSRPAGARVYINGRLVGVTPLAIPDIPAGPSAVRIDLDGYETWTTTVVVSAGEPARVNASLDRR